MPELPELEIVREVLDRRVVGQTVATVAVVPPVGALVLRDVSGGGLQGLVGQRVASVARRGKFLLFEMGALWLVINPKLSGRLQLARAQDKRLPKTGLVLGLSDGAELRYVDQKSMGQVYLTPDLARVPDYADEGPEALDIDEEAFAARLKPYRGEIKGILIRNDFVAGIGNAYADEILWTARLHPYRKRTSLTPADVHALYTGLRRTLLDAIDKVRAEMGEAIHLKPRDFMAVHMKAGQPCPRCGNPISEVSAGGRITNFCRTCQPGGLIKGMGG
jgi:formamidopyrimidine-DNA glycosylase